MEFLVDFGSAWVWSLAGFGLLWLISLGRQDASLVDFWWGPGFGVMAIAFWLQSGQPDDARALVLLGLLSVWSLRLGVQLGRRRLREGVEDGRYSDLRAHYDPGWWWKSLFVVFLLQAVLQGLIGAAILAAIAAPAVGIGPFGILAAAVTLAGITLQTISDTQLDRFRRHNPHGSLLTTGLRAHVRYPSYLGEIMVWFGLSALAVGAGIWWAPISALVVILLIRFVSGVTVLDARLAKTRSAYPPYHSKTPALLPRMRLWLTDMASRNGV